MPDLSSGLIGHWPLGGDLNDHSPLRHPTSSIDVEVGQVGPRGKPATAARFNGRSSQLEAVDRGALALGAGDFTLAAWVSTDGATADIVGDIIGKYDTATRRGFNLLVLTSDGVTSAAQSNYRQLQFGIDDGRIESVWRDHGRPGEAAKVAALTASAGNLYAGTFEKEPNQVGRLWRFDGGQRWIDLGNPLGCNCISAVAEFDGAL